MTTEERAAKNSGYSNGKYNCNSCDETIEQDISHSCLPCGFDYCDNCHEKLMFVLHDSHEHPLRKATHEDRMKISQGYKGGFNCNECSETKQGDNWFCENCKYDMCFDCHENHVSN